MDQPVAEILQPVEIIIDAAVGRAGQRIDGEVAARRVQRPVVRIGDPGPPAVGFHIHPQRGDFEKLFANDGGYRTVIDAGGNGLDARRLQQTHDPFRRCREGHVDVPYGAFEQGVADAAANEPHLGPFGGQGRQHRPGFRRLHPRLRRERAHSHVVAGRGFVALPAMSGGSAEGPLVRGGVGHGALAPLKIGPGVVSRRTIRCGRGRSVHLPTAEPCIRRQPARR